MNAPIVAPSGIAKTIIVRRSGFATWLDIDGVFIGLHPEAMVDLDVDPSEQPSIRLRLFAERVYVDNSAHVAADDGGYGDGEADREETKEATEQRVRVPEREEVSDL